jgi:hypothetical protein
MFQFEAFAPSRQVGRVMGLSHSDIRGSTLLCSSPQLFAALHVLHRLSVPRHPPCALSCLLLNHCAGRPAQQITQPCYWFVSPFVLSHSVHTHALTRSQPACALGPEPEISPRPKPTHAAISALATSILPKNCRGAGTAGTRFYYLLTFTAYLLLLRILFYRVYQKTRGASRIRTGDPLLARQVL